MSSVNPVMPATPTGMGPNTPPPSKRVFALDVRDKPGHDELIGVTAKPVQMIFRVRVLPETAS
jgi:hypothetical protein